MPWADRGEPTFALSAERRLGKLAPEAHNSIPTRAHDADRNLVANLSSGELLGYPSAHVGRRLSRIVKLIKEET